MQKDKKEIKQTEEKKQTEEVANVQEKNDAKKYKKGGLSQIQEILDYLEKFKK